MRFGTGILIALVLCGCGSTTAASPSSQTVAANQARARTVRATSSLSGSGSATTHRQPAVRIAGTPYGQALVDRRGFALYLFTRDRPGSSTCYAACAKAWPPYLVRSRPSGNGHGARTGVIRRHDGRLQVTYNDHPLYYYVGDRRPHQILCQAATEFGGTWYVVSPAGRAIT